MVFSCFYPGTILKFLDRKIYSQFFRESRLNKRERIYFVYNEIDKFVLFSDTFFGRILINDYL